MALNLDLLPTFVQLAGDLAPPEIDGRSLIPILKNPTEVVRDKFLIHHTFSDVFPPLQKKPFVAQTTVMLSGRMEMNFFSISLPTHSRLIT